MLPQFKNNQIKFIDRNTIKNILFEINSQKFQKIKIWIFNFLIPISLKSFLFNLSNFILYDIYNLFFITLYHALKQMFNIFQYYILIINQNYNKI